MLQRTHLKILLIEVAENCVGVGGTLKILREDQTKKQIVQRAFSLGIKTKKKEKDVGGDVKR